MQRALDLPQNLTQLRSSYQHVQRLFTIKTADLELDGNQAVVFDINRPIHEEYARILTNQYRADLLPVNFYEPQNAAKVINNHINLKTRGKIPKFLEFTDLIDVQMMLISASFFKGKWKVRFNDSI